jgi:hypothetical protein
MEHALADITGLLASRAAWAAVNEAFHVCEFDAYPPSPSSITTAYRLAEESLLVSPACFRILPVISSNALRGGPIGNRPQDDIPPHNGSPRYN